MKTLLYRGTVTLLWIAGMTWLVTVLVMPWIFVGDPPPEAERLTARQETPIVWWEMQILPMTEAEFIRSEPADAIPESGLTGFLHKMNPFRPSREKMSVTDTKKTPESENASDAELSGNQTTRNTVRVFGQAYSRTRMETSGISHLCNVVELEGLPIRELLPTPLTVLIGRDMLSLENLRVVCRSEMWFDALGKLTLFESRIWVPSWSVESPFIRIRGELMAKNLREQLRLSVAILNETHVDHEILLNEETPWAEFLTPETQMPGLRIGQKWTIRRCNPFDTAVTAIQPLSALGISPSSGISVLRAEVTARKTLVWNGSPQTVLEVVYTDSSNDLHGAGANGRMPIGRMYVDESGNVLQEECYWNRHVLRFVRRELPPEGSEEFTELIRHISSQTSGVQPTGMTLKMKNHDDNE